VKVRIGIRRSIIVHDDVHSLDIDTATEDIGGNEDSLFEGLEGGISTDTKRNRQTSGLTIQDKSGVPFFLGKTGVDRNAWKIARDEQFIQFDGTGNGLYENDDLSGGY
jgi:hypothetical protein